MSDTKECNNCLQQFLITEFSTFKRKNGKAFLSQYCKKCKSLQASLRKRELKKKCIEYKGGKCERCGLISDHTTIYDFHHTDPSKKDFSVSEYTDKRSKKGVLDELLKIELDKCLLVCANCHRVEHDTLHGKIWNVTMAKPKQQKKV